MPSPLLPVIILAGGFGTRLKPVVDDRPKVLAPVAGKPFLLLLLQRLAEGGVQDVVLSTGHKGEQVEAFAKSRSPDGMRVRWVREPEPLGTAGALAFAMREANLGGAFVAMNGDTFFGGSLADLVHAQRKLPNAKAIIALASVDTADRYGRVLFEEDAGSGPVCVTGFVEKGASTKRDDETWINAGVYVLTPEALVDIPERTFVSLERTIFPQLAAGKTLWALRYPTAPFLDIGTPEDYARAALLLA